MSVFHRTIVGVMALIGGGFGLATITNAQTPEDMNCYDSEYIQELYKISEQRAEEYRYKVILHPEYAGVCRGGVRKAAEKKREAERAAAAQRRKNVASRVPVSSGTTGKYADDGLDDLPPPLIVVTPEKTPVKKAKPRTCSCPVGYNLTYGVCWDYSNGTSIMAGEYPWRDECKADYGLPGE